jgi:hypothetical protein
VTNHEHDYGVVEESHTHVEPVKWYFIEVFEQSDSFEIPVPPP